MFQELYSFIFSTGIVGDSFTLMVLHPKRGLLLDDIVTDNLNVMVEENEDSRNIFDFLQANNVSV